MTLPVTKRRLVWGFSVSAELTPQRKVTSTVAVVYCYQSLLFDRVAFDV